MTELKCGPLDLLPLFASDLEIAEAIVGKKFAKEWVKTRLPTLAGKPGFPPVDDFHGGRPVPLVRRFYEHYLVLTGRGFEGPSGRAQEGEWKSSRSRRHQT